MDQLEYHSYQTFAAEPPKPVLDLSVIGFEDRTLVLGYDLDRATVHVYARDGEIHFHRYRLNYSGEGVITLEHRHAKSFDAEDLRPTKRSFPERTDWTFAVRMLTLGYPLTFTTFDPANGDPSKRFHGELA